MSIIIAVLAGGKSRRMGQDKAEIVWNDDTLLARTVRLAQEVVRDVIVVGRTAPPNWPVPHVAFLPDAHPDQGPLGGLQTALERASDPDDLLLIACDLPAMTAEALRWLIAEAEERRPLLDGLVVTQSGHREPLFSVYTAHCLPLVHIRLEEGRRSLQGLLDAGRFESIEIPPHLAIALRDVDTPEDMDALRLEVEAPPPPILGESESRDIYSGWIAR